MNVSKKPPIKTKTNDAILSRLIDETNVFYNVGQNIFVIPEDKLRSLLVKFKETERRRKRWITPFTLLMSIVIAFATSYPFKNFIISSERWGDIFLFLSIFLIIWLFYSLKGLRKKMDIEDLIKEIKKSNH